MARVEKSIALPSEMIATLRASVDSNEYSNSSVVIRKALRNLVSEGMASGSGLESDPVFAHLRTKYTAMLPKNEA